MKLASIEDNLRRNGRHAWAGFLNWRGRRWMVAVYMPWRWSRGRRLPRVTLHHEFWRFGYLFGLDIGPARFEESGVEVRVTVADEFNPAIRRVQERLLRECRKQVATMACEQVTRLGGGGAKPPGGKAQW